MVNDPIGDMIARIKNAAERKRSKVSTPASRMRGRVLDVLQSEGYIRGYAADLDPAKLGAGLIAFVEVQLDRTTPDVFNRFREGVIGLTPVQVRDAFAKWVRPDDLFRPCPDPEIDDTACLTELPDNATADYAAWYDANILSSYFSEKKYPRL